MTEIKYVRPEDKKFWYTLDRHLPEREFDKKVRDKRGYVLFENNIPKGILRYELFWDNIPFCTLIFIEENSRKKGFGKELIKHWETDMKALGYGMLLTSTQTDEQAQHFYRKVGFKDCGCLLIDIPKYKQPMEMFMSKEI